MAIHTAVGRHSQRKGREQVVPRGAAKDIAQRRLKAILAVELDFHNDTPQGGLAVLGRDAHHRPRKSQRPIEVSAEALARWKRQVKLLNLPAEFPGLVLGFFEPLAKGLDLGAQCLDLL